MSSPTPQSQADRAAQDAEHYRAVLRELMDIGIDIARVLREQAHAQAAGAEPASDVPSGYDRVSRSVRRTVILARTLEDPVKPAAERIAARTKIIRDVEDAIQRETSGGEAESLRAELRERLDGPELDEAIGDRPIGDIIADIRHDLGLDTMAGTHPWMRRTPNDIRLLHARAKAPCMPCAAANLGSPNAATRPRVEPGTGPPG